MSRLEQKLQELGFQKALNPSISNVYCKNTTLYIFGVKFDNGKIIQNEVHFLVKWMPFESLQQAFSEMQRDLEILKDIDKPTPKKDIGNDLWEKDAKHMKELGEWERNQWNH